MVGGMFSEHIFTHSTYPCVNTKVTSDPDVSNFLPNLTKNRFSLSQDLGSWVTQKTFQLSLCHEVGVIM